MAAASLSLPSETLPGRRRVNAQRIALSPPSPQVDHRNSGWRRNREMRSDTRSVQHDNVQRRVRSVRSSKFFILFSY